MGGPGGGEGPILWAHRDTCPPRLPPLPEHFNDLGIFQTLCRLFVLHPVHVPGVVCFQLCSFNDWIPCPEQ